jgi:uncharacterized protein YbjT (DUF2867 family)
MILVVGAAGKFAGLVVPALARRGARVRGLVRKPEQLEQVTAAGAVEAAIGDLVDPASLETALDGVEAIFYVAPAFLLDEGDVGRRVVEAAVQAGVRRFVFSAVIHPVLTGLPHHTAKIPVEAAVLDSGMEYSFLHPSLYFQNYARLWSQVIRTGVLAEPWSANTRFSRVDYRDVAEAAAIALTEDRLLYGTFELCAPGTLNRWDVAARIAEIIGREIKVERVDPREDFPGMHIPPPAMTMFEHYDHHGLLGNPLTLRAVLGREPRSLDAYFRELADSPA